MADIETLKFDVVLDPTKFNNTAGELEKRAKTLSETIGRLAHLKQGEGTVQKEITAQLGEQVALENKSTRAASGKAKQVKLVAANEAGVLGLKRMLLKIDEKSLSIGAQELIAKAQAGQLTAKEIRDLRQLILLENDRLKLGQKQAAGMGTQIKLLGKGSIISKAVGGWMKFTMGITAFLTSIRIFIRGFRTAVKQLAEFEQANVNMSTIMQVSRKEIGALTEDALMLGRTTEWTARQVTQLQTELAKLGYTIPQIQNMQKSVLQFATAVGADLPDAASFAGASLRSFGMHSSETQKLLEILTASTNKSALDFDKLRVAMPYVGATAHAMGLDVGDAASLLAVLSNAGLEASMAGTGLRRILLELGKSGSKLQKAMGGNVKTMADFVNGLRLLRDRGLGAGEAYNLVGQRAQNALLLLANGVDTIDDLNRAIRDTNGLLEKTQKERLDTLHGSTLLFKSAWESLIQTFRDSNGTLKEIVDWATGLVRNLSLAISLKNRLAQGGRRGAEYEGSDAMSERYKNEFERIRKDYLGKGLGEGAAAKKAQEDVEALMVKEYARLWQNKVNADDKRDYGSASSYAEHLAAKRQATVANEARLAAERTRKLVGAFMNDAVNEAVDIEAENLVTKWQYIFDTQGEKAVREAMSKESGHDNEKGRLEYYIANGGALGEEGRNEIKVPGGSAESRAKDRIQAQVSLLKEMKEAYDKYKALDNVDIAAKFEEFFPDSKELWKNFDFVEQLEKYAMQLMAMGDRSAAQGILNYIARDWQADVENIKKLQQAQEKWNESLEDLEATTKRLKLDGLAGDLDKIIVDADSKNRKLQTDWAQKARELAENQTRWEADYRLKNKEASDEEVHKAWDAYYKKETDKAKKFIDTQVDYNNKVAQRQINNKASAWVKEMMEKGNIDLSNLSDKSVPQLNALIDRLRALISTDALAKLIPAELIQDAKLTNAEFTELLSTIQQIVNTKIEDVAVEKEKAVLNKASKYAKILGLNADFSGLQDAYARVQEANSRAAAATERFNKAKANLFSDESRSDVEKMEAAWKEWEEAQDAAEDATNEQTDALKELKGQQAAAAIMLLASAMEKYGDALVRIGEAGDNAGLRALGNTMNTISGVLSGAAGGFAVGGPIGAVIGAMSGVIDKVLDAAAEQAEYMKEMKEGFDEYAKSAKAALLEMTEYSDMFGEQLAKKAHDAFQTATRASREARDAYKELYDATVMLDHVGFFESTNGGSRTKTALLRDLFPGIFENGHLNIDLANAALNALPTGGKSRDWNEQIRKTLEEGIAAEQAWQDAIKALDDVIKGFTGDWASSLADAMWSAIESGEDAWEAWHKVGSEAISDIGKQMLAEMIQSSWLGKYEEELRDAFKGSDNPAVVWQKVGDIAARMFDDVDQNYNQYLDVARAWQDWMTERGYNMQSDLESANSESLGGQIKSTITEDTASLLASYINAIRADVSTGKSYWERIAVAVEAMSGISGAPTLSEYEQEIQSHQRNIDSNTASILTELRDVIQRGGAGGYNGIRVVTY